jgi:hypothetical protein
MDEQNQLRYKVRKVPENMKTGPEGAEPWNAGRSVSPKLVKYHRMSLLRFRNWEISSTAKDLSPKAVRHQETLSNHMVGQTQCQKGIQHITMASPGGPGFSVPKLLATCARSRIDQGPLSRRVSYTYPPPNNFLIPAQNNLLRVSDRVYEL